MFGLNAYALPRDLSSNELVEKECVTSQLRKKPWPAREKKFDVRPCKRLKLAKLD